MIKIRVLFINNTQFGYMLDMDNYFEYLPSDYLIKVICLDQKKKKKENKYKNLEVDYIFANNKYIKLIKFMIKILLNIYSKKYDKIFIANFKGCFLIGILSYLKKNITLDIRTQSVNPIKKLRKLEDLDIRLATIFFRNISIISHGCAKNLKIKKYSLLPLAGKKIVSQNLKNDFNILYIGTFEGRRLGDTIIGVIEFKKKYPEVKFKYRIIGDGKEKEELKKLIKLYKAQEYIELLGFLPYDESKKYFEVSKIGVSYIPINDYYNYQPPTKTYEYIANGLFCLGTKTYANMEVINNKNGILCEDNSFSFFESLEKIYLCNLRNILSLEEREKFTWKIVVKDYLIKNILKDKESEK